MMDASDATFFDPKAEFGVLERSLPHRDQPGAFAFVTFRLADSIPSIAAKQWRANRNQILIEAGVDPDNESETIVKLPKRDASLLRWKLYTTWDMTLDELRGECQLRDRRASQIVADGILKFDPERYVVSAFAIMPNHVHLLAAFANEGAMIKQGEDWRRFWARQINPLFGRTGHFWQPDQFDHLVRSPESFDRIRNYIIDNPKKAGLTAGQNRIFVSPSW
jgi:putative transposase